VRCEISFEFRVSSFEFVESTVQSLCVTTSHTRTPHFGADAIRYIRAVHTYVLMYDLS